MVKRRHSEDVAEPNPAAPTSAEAPPASSRDDVVSLTQLAFRVGQLDRQVTELLDMVTRLTTGKMAQVDRAIMLLQAEVAASRKEVPQPPIDNVVAPFWRPKE